MMMDDHIIAQADWIICTGWNNTTHHATCFLDNTLTVAQYGGVFRCLSLGLLG